MVSFIVGSYNTVKEYDSMNRQLSSTTIKPIAGLLHIYNNFFNTEYIQMPYQSGCNDCGLFAIALACAVSQGFDPSRTTFNQGKMRSHLFNALLKILHHSQLWSGRGPPGLSMCPHCGKCE